MTPHLGPAVDDSTAQDWNVLYSTTNPGCTLSYGDIGWPPGWVSVVAGCYCYSSGAGRQGDYARTRGRWPGELGMDPMGRLSGPRVAWGQREVHRL